MKGQTSMSDVSVAQSAENFTTQAQAARPNMEAWALRYVELGFHIIPCHEPLFDDQHGYLCTCEQYRHTDRCKEKHPHLYLEGGAHCSNPGKHPRGLEHGLKDATNDPNVVRKWWTKHPNAPIAHVPGLAGLVLSLIHI